MTQDLAAELARLRALHEIQQLPIRYANCMDRKDVEGLLPLFSDRISMGPAGKGRDGVRSFYRGAWSRFRRSVHRISNHRIDLTGAETATGHVYCLAEQQHLAEDRWDRLMLSYDDRYVLEDGLWRFAARKLGIWYRDSDGQRLPGSDNAFARSLPDCWPEWQSFIGQTQP
jgi:hypothetical protein